MPATSRTRTSRRRWRSERDWQALPVAPGTKIDKSLIAEIGVAGRNSSIAGAAISLAHSLNLTVTAEGAYAAWQARYLRARRCDLVQGYYFGRPVPAHKFAALLRKGKPVRLGPGYINPGNAGWTGKAAAS